MHESEKWKWSHSVVSNSYRPHGLQPNRLLRPWDSPGKNTGVGCHFLLQCMRVKSENEVAQSCPTLTDPMDCSLTGSSVHGIFQARVLEWGSIAFSKIYMRSSLMENVERYGASKTKLETKTSTNKTWIHSTHVPETIHAEKQDMYYIMTVFNITFTKAIHILKCLFCI